MSLKLFPVLHTRTQRYVLSTFVRYKREFYFFTLSAFFQKHASKQARNSRKKLKCILLKLMQVVPAREKRFLKGRVR